MDKQISNPDSVMSGLNIESDVEFETGSTSGRDFISQEDFDSGRIMKDVLINPLIKEHFRKQNYLLTLGKHYFSYSGNKGSVNPESRKSNKNYWGDAQKAAELSPGEYKLNNIQDKQKYIKIPPGKTILTHTEEFIGVSDGMTFIFRPLFSMISCAISVEIAQGGHYYDRCIVIIKNNSDAIAYLREGCFISEVSFIRLSTPTTESGFGKDKNALRQIEEVWKAENLLIRKGKPTIK